MPNVKTIINAAFIMVGIVVWGSGCWWGGKSSKSQRDEAKLERYRLKTKRSATVVRGAVPSRIKNNQVTLNKKAEKYHGPLVFEGVASYYGRKFHGKKTASGEIFNMFDYTAAHKELPFGTVIKVTNLSNNRSVIVRINDRGPFVKDRILDLSYAAAKSLDMLTTGVAKVRIEVIRLKE